MPRPKKAPKEEPGKEQEVSEAQALEVMQDKDIPERGQTAVVRYDAVTAVDVQPEIVQKKLEAIRVFQNIVRDQLIEGQDFGTIPGTPKPTLLKPGAEKIIKLLNLADVNTVEDKVEDWNAGFFYYRVKCTLTSLITGQVVATGMGSCNSKEDKYRYRWVPEYQLTETQKKIVEDTHPPFKVRQGGRGEYRLFRFDNEEIYTQVNTVLKMASKRAKVDAALSVGRLSNVFSQDEDDTVEYSTFPGGKKRGRPAAGGKADASAPPKPRAPKETESYPMVTLKLTDGSSINVTQYQSLNYFKAIKDSLNKATGDDASYYATLEQFGFKHANEIPIEKIPGVWDTMVGVWKTYKAKG